VGARNVDSACTGTTIGDYLRATDLSHLPQEAMALYLDRTESNMRSRERVRRCETR
jgi:hypothetical protein